MIDRSTKARLLREGAAYFDRQGNPNAAEASRKAADRLGGVTGAIRGVEMPLVWVDEMPDSLKVEIGPTPRPEVEGALKAAVRRRSEILAHETESLCFHAMRAYGLPASALVLVRQRTETGERIWVEPRGRR